MEIRVIGTKEEIEAIIRALSGIFEVRRSRLYTARGGGYRCYLNIK